MFIRGAIATYPGEGGKERGRAEQRSRKGGWQKGGMGYFYWVIRFK